jgi:SAM-dependent methyltransferase
VPSSTHPLHSAAPLRAPRPATRHAAQIFNDYLLAHVLFALQRTGQLDELAGGGLPADMEAPDGRGAVLRTCLQILEDAGLAAAADGVWRLTPHGVEVAGYAGFFVWEVGGYASHFNGLADALQGGESPAADPHFVTLGSSMMDAAMLQRQLDDLLDERSPKAVADLGCGNGSRMIRFLLRHPAATGVGVERRAAGVARAHDEIAARQLGGRMSVIEADCLGALDLPAAERERVEAVWSFFLLHDLMSECGGRFEEVARAVTSSFPNVRTVLFADTTSDDWRPHHPSTPIFSRGFQLVHAAMGIRTRTVAEYEEAFRDGPLALVDTVALDVPNSYLFTLSRR